MEDVLVIKTTIYKKACLVYLLLCGIVEAISSSRESWTLKQKI